MSIARTWSTKRSLASVEILPSMAASLFLLAVRGPRENSKPYLDRPGFRQRSILSIRLAPRCHANPTIENPQNRIGALRLPPTTATTQRTKATSAFASRLRADTPKSHTHMQHSCPGIPVDRAGER